MINFLTYHDGTEPFKTMARDLDASIVANTDSRCHVFEVQPNGGHYLIEFYSALYPNFSQMISDGPVVVLDADCIVMKPIDDLFEKNFAIAAIHRGKCTNSSGRQDFLGSLIGFSPACPNLVRKLWQSWIADTWNYIEKPPVAQAALRHESLKEKGWHSNWYGGQSAYNEMLYRAEAEDPGSVLRLDREKYSARPGTEDAYIWHRKGGRKLR